MRPTSIAFALLATAAVSGVAGGFLGASLAPHPRTSELQHSAAASPQPAVFGSTADAVETLPDPHAKRSLENLTERLDRLLDWLASEPLHDSDARKPVAAPSPGSVPDLVGLRELVERIEKAETKLGSKLSGYQAGSSGGPPPLTQRRAPTDWGAFDSLFVDSDDQAAQDQAQERFSLLSLGEVLAQLGRPTSVWSNQAGMSLRYERDGRYLSLHSQDGYVTRVELSRR